MKYIRVIFAIIILSAVTALADQTDYSNGYKEGYKQGWCYGYTFCIDPIPPIPPIAPIGKDTYQGGYNDGFLKGMAKRAASRW